MSGASGSKRAIERFYKSELAPSGEWWYEFSVGLSLQDDMGVGMGDRRIDGICVTSRSSTDPNWLSRPETREKRESGWLNNEQVVIVEHGLGRGAWAKYGQMDIRRRMFEMDWPDTTVVSSVVLRETETAGGNEDTLWMFENDLDGCELLIEYEGEYFEYSDFLEEVC